MNKMKTKVLCGLFLALPFLLAGQEPEKKTNNPPTRSGMEKSPASESPKTGKPPSVQPNTAEKQTIPAPQDPGAPPSTSAADQPVTDRPQTVRSFGPFEDPNKQLEARVEVSSKAAGRYTAVLIVNSKLTPKIYKRFQQPAPEFLSGKYTLKGDNLDLSGSLTSSDLQKEFRVSKDFFSNVELDKLHLGVALEGRFADRAGPQPEQVNAYYDATKELEDMIARLDKFDFLKGDLVDQKKQLDVIATRYQQILDYKFEAALDLAKGDPVHMMNKLDELRQKIPLQHKASLESAIQQLNLLAVNLRKVSGDDPDVLPDDRKTIENIQSKFGEMKGLQFPISLPKYNTDKYLEASSQLSEHLNLMKDSVDRAFANRHQMYLRKGQISTSPDRKRYFFQKAVDTATKPFADPHYQLALLSKQEGDLEQCIFQLEQALAAEPSREMYDRCGNEFRDLFMLFLRRGDQEKGENGISWYQKALRLCAKPNLNFNCLEPAARISERRIEHFNILLSQGKTSGNLDQIAEARQYYTSNASEIALDGQTMSNQAFEEQLVRRYNQSAKNFANRQLAPAWEAILDIHALEQTYHIRYPVPRQLEDLVQKIYKAALYSAGQLSEPADKYSVTDYSQASQTLTICQAIAEHPYYSNLAYQSAQEFNKLYCRVQEGLFRSRLAEVGTQAQNGNFSTADSLLSDARSQMADSTAAFGAKDWRQWQNAQNAFSQVQFLGLLTQSKQDIARKQWSLAEKKWKKAKALWNHNEVLRGDSENEMQLNDTWRTLVSTKFDNRLKDCRQLLRTDHLADAIDSLLCTSRFVDTSATWLESSAPVVLREQADRTATSVLALCTDQMMRLYFLEATNWARKGLRLRKLIPTSSLQKLQAAYVDGFLAETDIRLKPYGEGNIDNKGLTLLRQFHDSIALFIKNENFVLLAPEQVKFENLKKRVREEVCSRYWNLYSNNLTKAVALIKNKDYIMACERLQITLDSLRDKSLCQIDQSEAESLLAINRPAAEYKQQINRLQVELADQQYEEVIDRYQASEEFYQNQRLYRFEALHVTFEEFALPQKDPEFLKFAILRYCSDHNKIHLYQSLLPAFLTLKPQDLESIGLEIGKKFHVDQLDKAAADQFMQYCQITGKPGKKFKKAFWKGYKGSK